MAADERSETLRRKRNHEIFKMWMDIQDIVGAAKLWPHFIRKLFWTKHLNHSQRPIICAFVFVNGLNPVVNIHVCTVHESL